MENGAREVPELIPARMVNAYAFCPRLAHLEWVQQEFEDNVHTIEGRHDHRRVDQESGKLPVPEDLTEESRLVRGLLLSAPKEGLIARLDIAEAENGEVRPVDYKHGRPPREGGVWPADRAQAGVQALVLLENGYTVPEAVLYYVKTKQRVTIPVDEALLEETRSLVREFRERMGTAEVPPPLEDSPKCVGCSLAGICLPDETVWLRGGDGNGEANVRLLYPARDDALPVYVQSQGTRVSKKGDTLLIRSVDGEETKVRLLDTSQLCLLGNVQVTTQTMNALLGAGIPVLYFSRGGWFYGMATGLGSRNAFARLEQFRACEDPDRSLALARGFVARKIRNCRTLLRRNHSSAPGAVLDQLEDLARRVMKAQSAEALLGLEGTAARLYFGEFTGMLKGGSEGELPPFAFEARNRRPPRDPVNALLSLAYSCLAKDWTVVLQSVSLDPYLGFYHRPRFGRPALALDMMEEFRPLVADSVVLGMINNGEVKMEDFVQRGAGVALKDGARKKFFAAYERRMDVRVRVPLFGYRVSYRRLLEVQARLLIRYLTGEIAEYPGFTTR